MKHKELCEHLKWDSEIFKFPVARIQPTTLDSLRMQKAIDWCKTNSIRCAYFLSDDDGETKALLEEEGFQLVDERVTMSRPLDPPVAVQVPEDVILRPSRASDISDLQAMARVNHQDTRFYFDKGFSREACDRLYETWIRNNCEKGSVLVVEKDLINAGYVTCTTEGREGKLGLLGVHEEFRGQGLGKFLLGMSLQWFSDKSMQSVSVIAQKRNKAALSLYERWGFRTVNVQKWYHKWF